MENIISGLNKTAILSDLYKNKTMLGKLFQSREKDLARAIDLKTKNRIANTPNNVIRDSFPSSLTSIPKYFKDNLKRHISETKSGILGTPLSPYTTAIDPNTFSKTVIYLPNGKNEIKSYIKSNQKRLFNPNKLNNKHEFSVAHNLSVNHELDEANMIRNAIEKNEYGSSMFSGYKSRSKMQDKAHKSILNSIDRIESFALKNPYLNKRLDADKFKKDVNTYKYILNNGMKSGNRTAAHAGPEILLHESNRSFHEATPKAREYFTNLRKSTGEHDYMRRNLGVRYGEEYIPPNGRRWNSIVNRSAKDIDESGYIQLDKKLKQKNEYLKNRNSK